MLRAVLSLPFVLVGNLVAFIFRTTLSVILLPVKLIQGILRSIFDRLNATVSWAEPKISYLRTIKPLAYVFPLKTATGHSDDCVESDAPDVQPSYLGITHGKTKRDLSSSRGTRRRRPPSQATPTHQHIPKRDDDQGPPLPQSMSHLIQELLEFSKHHSPAHKTSVPPSTIIAPSTSDSIDDDDGDDDNGKVLKLIHELQEFATSKTRVSDTQSVTSPDHKTNGTDDVELNQMLNDLGVFESYVSRFLDEQQQPVVTLSGGDMPMIDIGSLETITEEETSKECSPVSGGETTPPQGIQSSATPGSLQQCEISSEELQILLKQISDTVRQTIDTTPTHTTSIQSQPQPLLSPQEITSKQFEETEKEFQSVIDSLETQHKFIETQQELQSMMDSLDPDTVISSSSNNTTSQQPQSTDGGDLYDMLSPTTPPPPIYSIPNKEKANISDTSITDPLPPDDDQIYDSLLNFSTETTADNPPPLPLKRTLSDGSTSSNEHSPQVERRRHSHHHHHHSSDEDHGSHHGRHHHHHSHRSRKHRRHSSSSSRRSDHHCCCHDDHSHDGCGHHSRPRSRDHHHRNRSRSDSDESVHMRRRIPRESSGYESQELESSPSFARKVGRSHSEAMVGTMGNTPKEVRRGFLSGLFSRRSTTSLNSLSSRMSDTGDNYSVSSYRI